MKKTLLKKIAHFELDTFLDNDEVKQIEKALLLQECIENISTNSSVEDFFTIVMDELAR